MDNPKFLCEKKTVEKCAKKQKIGPLRGTLEISTFSKLFVEKVSHVTERMPYDDSHCRYREYKYCVGRV